MADDWWYAQHGERKGPVSLARLKALADDGWLVPDDLVWRAGLEDWIPAREGDELFSTPLGRVLRRAIAGVRPAPRRPTSTHLPDRPPPVTSGRAAPPTRRAARPESVGVDWADLSPRHLVAACGGFLAALGVAFTTITPSRIAMAFTLSGIVIAAVGLHVEIGRLVARAAEFVGEAWREAAERRLRGRELALEKRRLDLEAARLANGQLSRATPAAPLADSADGPLDRRSTGADGAGQVVVINEPPMRRWSPGLAAALSLLMPGLGQLYKGQIVNGIVWLLIVSMGYLALVVPGLILHVLCVLGALSGNPWTERRTTVLRR